MKQVKKAPASKIRAMSCTALDAVSYCKVDGRVPENVRRTLTATQPSPSIEAASQGRECELLAEMDTVSMAARPFAVLQPLSSFSAGPSVYFGYATGVSASFALMRILVYGTCNAA